MKKISIILVFLILCIFVSTASAIHFDSCEGGDLTLTYVNNSAGYNDEFGYVTNSNNFHLLDNTFTAVPNTNYPIGLYNGDDVSVYIKSPDNHIYKSYEPAGDSVPYPYHTKVYQESDGSWTVGFEDLWGGGDLDYNDVFLNVACTPKPIPTPEFPSVAVPAALLVGLIGTVMFVRNTGKNN